MSKRIVPFFFYPRTGECLPLGAEDVALSEERKIRVQIQFLGPRFERPRIRLFIPASPTPIQFFSHRRGAKPAELWRVYHSSSAEECDKDFSPYEGGRLYELKESDQTLILYQREIGTSVAGLTIVEVAGQQIEISCYPVTVVSRGEVTGIPEHIRERYADTLCELFNPLPQEFPKRKEEEGNRGENRSRSVEDLKRLMDNLMNRVNQSA